MARRGLQDDRVVRRRRAFSSLVTGRSVSPASAEPVIVDGGWSCQLISLFTSVVLHHLLERTTTGVIILVRRAGPSCQFTGGGEEGERWFA